MVSKTMAAAVETSSAILRMGDFPNSSEPYAERRRLFAPNVNYLTFEKTVVISITVRNGVINEASLRASGGVFNVI
jgi:hypothetical protein